MKTVSEWIKSVTPKDILFSGKYVASCFASAGFIEKAKQGEVFTFSRDKTVVSFNKDLVRVIYNYQILSEGVKFIPFPMMRSIYGPKPNVNLILGLRDLFVSSPDKIVFLPVPGWVSSTCPYCEDSKPCKKCLPISDPIWEKEARIFVSSLVTDLQNLF